MRKIPLNVQTMYADLAQNIALDDDLAGSVTTRTINGRSYLYVTTKDGARRLQRSLGPADSPAAQAEADRFRRAAARARAMRTTVSALKRAHLPAPTMALGRVLEVVANAGLFRDGSILVGTAAYQTYAASLGYYLPGTAVMTNDADLLVASFVSRGVRQDMEEILRKADPTFQAHMNIDDRLPKIFRAADMFQVDILTKFGRGRKPVVPIHGLTCAAQALRFMEYLSEESIDAVALHGPGIAVRVPPPLRYGIHKLLIAPERRGSITIKRNKDLAQASDIIDIFMETDEDALVDALDGARAKGPRWKANINASLKEIGRDTAAGQPPKRIA